VSTFPIRRMMGGATLLLEQVLATPPPPTLLKRHAIDVSNYTGNLSVQAIQAWRDQYDVGLVIVQSLDAGRFTQSRTQQQLLACQAAGMTVDVYVYPFFANGAGDCARRLTAALSAGVPIRRVWLDVEDVDPSQAAWTPSQRADMLKRWLQDCDAFPARVHPAGVYTGRWYWTGVQYMDNWTEAAFFNRPLWDSDFDSVADVDYGWAAYGGWSHREVKQYVGTSTVAGVGNVDQNVLSDAERARV
jgi:hypothetical protein